MAKILLPRLARRRFYRSPHQLFLFFNLGIIIIIFLLGFNPKAFKPKIETSDLAYYNGQAISFRGRVCEEADLDYKSRRLTVCALGRILITTDLYPAYDYGDFLLISGELETPAIFTDFDYANYLARFDIYSVMYYPQINKTDGDLNYPQKIYLLLIKLKRKLKNIIEFNLPEPEAGLAAALLLGYRRTVSREDLAMFSRVGLSHMIAISGSHITILSSMILSFFLALGFRRRRIFWIVFIFLSLYPLITGLSASAVRSAIMGALAFLAAYYQRSSSLIRALVFSAALMLIINPQILRADVGFQLSFAAILGIIYLYPLGEGIIKRFLEKLNLRTKAKKIWLIILETINLTLVSQIIILPIVLINFKQLSIIAPLANVFVLWVFAPLLAALIIAVLSSLIIPGLSQLLFLPAYLLLKYIFVLSSLLAAAPWAAVTVNGFNWYQGGLYYLCLIILIRVSKSFYKKTLPN